MLLVNKRLQVFKRFAEYVVNVESIADSGIVFTGIVNHGYNNKNNVIRVLSFVIWVKGRREKSRFLALSKSNAYWRRDNEITGSAWNGNWCYQYLLQ